MVIFTMMDGCLLFWFFFQLHSALLQHRGVGLVGAESLRTSHLSTERLGAGHMGAKARCRLST